MKISKATPPRPLLTSCNVMHSNGPFIHYALHLLCTTSATFHPSTQSLDRPAVALYLYTQLCPGHSGTLIREANISCASEMHVLLLNCDQ